MNRVLDKENRTGRTRVRGRIEERFANRKRR